MENRVQIRTSRIIHVACSLKAKEIRVEDVSHEVCFLSTSTFVVEIGVVEGDGAIPKRTVITLLGSKSEHTGNRVL